ncbi:MAG TPA: hypothetical protein VF593_04390 [Chthoniobacteraceae bacterium]|jgi:ABC-type dipeptide/oligopeptide/nickel transport system permease subunit
MNVFRQAWLPIVALIGYGAFVQYVPDRGITCLAAVAASTLTALVLGPRLPLTVRLFITGVVFHFGYGMCLAGRTMEPGLTSYTVRMALMFFSLFALLPFLSLARIWRPRLAIPVIAAALPVCLGAAALVASIEERQFVQRHRIAGIGPTARWTVSNHWLSYDAQRQQLNGSD